MPSVRILAELCYYDIQTKVRYPKRAREPLMRILAELFIIKMRKIIFGLILGVLAGIIDLIPMLIQKLTWDANLSAVSLWIVSGALIATSNIKLNGALKGILVSFLVLIPCAFIIGWQKPISLVPIAVMTLILGAILGYLIEKFGK